MMENAPYLMQQLALQLKVNVGELRKMSIEGKLTSDVLIEAFAGMAGKVNEQFAEVPLTAARGFEVLKNSFSKQLDVFNETSHVTQGLARGALILSENMELLFTVMSGAALVKFSSMLSDTTAKMYAKATASGKAAQAAVVEATADKEAAMQAANKAQHDLLAAETSEKKAIASYNAAKAQQAVNIAELEGAELAAANTASSWNSAKAKEIANQRVLAAQTALNASTLALAETERVLATATAATVVAQDAQVVAMSRLATATGALATAKKAATVAVQGFGAALSLVGGWVGVAVIAISTLIAYWDDVKAAAGDAAAAQRLAATAGRKNVAAAGMGDIRGVTDSKKEYREAVANRKRIEQEVAGFKAAISDPRTDDKSRALASEKLRDASNNLTMAWKTEQLTWRNMGDSVSAYNKELGNVPNTTKKAVLSADELADAQRRLGTMFDKRTQYDENAAKEAAKAVKDLGVDTKDPAYKGLLEAAKTNYMKANPFTDAAANAAVKAREKQVKIEDQYSSSLRETQAQIAALRNATSDYSQTEEQLAEIKARSEDEQFIKRLKLEGTEKGKIYLQDRENLRRLQRDEEDRKKVYKEREAAEKQYRKTIGESYVAEQELSDLRKEMFATAGMSDYAKQLYVLAQAEANLAQVRKETASSAVGGTSTDQAAAIAAAEKGVTDAKKGVATKAQAIMDASAEWARKRGKTERQIAIEEATRAYEAEKELLVKDERDTTLLTEQHLQNMSRLYADFGDSTAIIASSFADSFESAFGNMEDALTDFAMTGKLDFKSMVDSMIRDLIRFSIQQSVMSPLKQGISDLGGFGGILSKLFGNTGGVGSNFTTSGDQFMSVPSAAGGFDIPSGTNPLTQLHENEMVLPAKYANVIRDLESGGGVSGGGDVQVNIINNSSQPVSAKASEPQWNGREMVVQVVLEDLRRNGPIRQTMKGIM